MHSPQSPSDSCVLLNIYRRNSEIYNSGFYSTIFRPSSFFSNRNFSVILSSRFYDNTGATDRYSRRSKVVLNLKPVCRNGLNACRRWQEVGRNATTKKHPAERFGAQKRNEEHPRNKRVWHGMPCCQHTVKAAPRTTAMKMKAEG